MVKSGAALAQMRREEIISACGQLYAQRGFQDVTIKDIGALTSFTRTSIYNYFETKEEIFLALLGQEYRDWISDLSAMAAAPEDGAEGLARGLAESLSRRETMLRLMSTSLFEMEENSRTEALADFKQTFLGLKATLGDCVAAYCPALTAEDLEAFLFAFLPLVYGVWPYATVTEKQRRAMEMAKVSYEPPTVYDLVYRGARMILEGLKHR